ncbi:MAG: chorismate synthase, partial [Corallococcus sp.]|nr:chorismate synthase [Corallococcus sp.]
TVKPQIYALRSGHVDVVSAQKFGTESVRDVNERASARNSLCYVVLGAVCKQILQKFGIYTFSSVENIGGTEIEANAVKMCGGDVYRLPKVKEAVDGAREVGDSLGGSVCVTATGVPQGLGDCFPYCRRLDGVIAASMMSIPSVKSVEFGLGKTYASLKGTEAHDELGVEGGRIIYVTNNCGGIVGGMTTGSDIVVHLTVKPVPTVKGVGGIDSRTLQKVEAHYERADTCVVPNVGTIAENMLAYVLLDEILRDNKFQEY